MVSVSVPCNTSNFLLSSTTATMEFNYIPITLQLHGDPRQVTDTMIQIRMIVAPCAKWYWFVVKCDCDVSCQATNWTMNRMCEALLCVHDGNATLGQDTLCRCWRMWMQLCHLPPFVKFSLYHFFNLWAVHHLLICFYLAFLASFRILCIHFGPLASSRIISCSFASSLALLHSICNYENRLPLIYF